MTMGVCFRYEGNASSYICIPNGSYLQIGVSEKDPNNISLILPANLGIIKSKISHHSPTTIVTGGRKIPENVQFERSDPVGFELGKTEITIRMDNRAPRDPISKNFLYLGTLVKSTGATYG